MLVLILIVAVILLLVIYIVASVRQHDADSFADQDRDPFFRESARLAAAGLLYEQAERTYGRPRKSYTVTPAGEAALRTWLRKPMADPGMLRLYFAGIVAPGDVLDLARQMRERHARRCETWDRVGRLLENAGEEWDDARAVVDLGRRFDGRARDFWAAKSDQPMDGMVPTRGGVS